MALRLVSSGDDRALAIRDHILPLLREYGALEVQRDAVRLIELRIGAWTFRHWTPFNDLVPGEASSPGYRRAVERQHTKPDLPYRLDVYHGGQVLRRSAATCCSIRQLSSFLHSCAVAARGQSGTRRNLWWVLTRTQPNW